MDHCHDANVCGADDSAQFVKVLEDYFPRAVPEHVFVEHVSNVLMEQGFTPETSINLVSTCRDELCRPFVDLLDSRWGDSFNISSLAGFVFCGRTGFKAAMAHAPIVNGVERYVFWVAPHIALSSDGTVGKCFRLGRDQSSSACGALLAVLKEIQSGKLNLTLDPRDLEQSLLKQALVSHLEYGHVPSLVELTYAAYECILAEVEKTAQSAIDPGNCEYIVVGGVQIHGPLGQNFFWPGTVYKMAAGSSEKIDLYDDYAASVNNWHLELKGWSASEALCLVQSRGREALLAAKNGDLAALKCVGVNLESVRDHHHSTLLHVSARSGKEDIVAYLIENHPGLVQVMDINHHTAIDYAIEGEHDKVAEMLQSAGAGLSGEVLRSHLVHAVEQMNLEEFNRYVRFAKDRNEALKATNADGKSLLHICMGIKDHEAERLKRQEELVSSLLDMGADANATDFFGRDVLQGSPGPQVPDEAPNLFSLVRTRSNLGGQIARTGSPMRGRALNALRPEPMSPGLRRASSVYQSIHAFGGSPKKLYNDAPEHPPHMQPRPGAETRTLKEALEDALSFCS